MKLYVFPGNIESEILDIGKQQIPYMRTQSFSDLVKSCEEMILNLIHCSEGKVIFFTSSGTGAMDAVVSNFVSSMKKTIILAGGAFGYRWKDICDYYHCSNTLFEIPFGKDICYDELEQSIINYKPEVLLCQHHETSTGQLYNLKKISELCQRHNVFLVVDAISSFLSDYLNMDDFHIDIAIMSSQKGLNLPPGLSFVVLSNRISQYLFLNKSYYFDFEENLKNLVRGQTPYSPATTLFLQLHRRLQLDIELGTALIIESVQQKALLFRELCKKYHWVIPAENPSNCITGFFVKKNGDKIFKELEKQGIYIMPGSIPSFFRISHLGLQTPEDLNELATAINTIEMTI